MVLNMPLLQINCISYLEKDIHLLCYRSRLRDERLRFNLNLEVQLLLRQGQVEVKSFDYIPDYTDSLLIHRSVVEDLNSTILVSHSI